MKEAFYFPHDNNAHNDPKLMSVLMGVGLSGVGMYWIIIETMHQEESGMISLEQYENIVRWYFSREKEGTSVEQVLNIFSTSGLFVFTGDGKVYSKRVVENKKFREELREKRKNAGKASAEKRASAKENQEDIPTHVEQVLNTGGTRKGKERKGNKKEIETETEKKYIKEKEILKLWNSFGKNIQHQESEKIFESVKKAFGKFSEEQIIKGIKVYGEVLLIPDAFFSYRWTLEEFLKREGGLNTFMHKSVKDYIKQNPGEKKPFVDYEAQKRETLARERKAEQEKKDGDNQKAAEKRDDDKIMRWFESLPEESELKKNIEKAIDENKTIKLGFDSLTHFQPGTLMYEQKLEAANKQRDRLKIVVIRQFYS